MSYFRLQERRIRYQSVFLMKLNDRLNNAILSTAIIGLPGAAWLSVLGGLTHWPLEELDEISGK